MARANLYVMVARFVRNRLSGDFRFVPGRPRDICLCPTAGLTDCRNARDSIMTPSRVSAVP